STAAAGHPRPPGAACNSTHPGNARARGRLARGRRRPVLRVAAPPFAGASGVLVGAGDGGVHADLPGDQPLGVGLSLQGGEDPLPAAVTLPAPKQPIPRLPWAVAGGYVPPRCPRPGAPADPVDQLAFAPPGWPAGLPARGEQRLQPGPLLISEVPSSHARSISRDPPTFETRPSVRV